jgi:parallel beta-helix repeat protein
MAPAGCDWFIPKPSIEIMEHSFEAKEGTIFDTGTGLTISVPPAATEGKMKLTVVYDPAPKQLGESAITLRSAYDISIASRSRSQGHPLLVTLTFEIPEDIDPLCVTILEWSNKGWVPARSEEGLPGGDVSLDGKHITVVRERLSRYAFAEWLYTHVLKHVEKLPQPPPLPPEVLVKEPEKVRDNLVVEATIRSPTILGELLPGPGIGVWRYVSIEDIEGLISVKGYGSMRYPDTGILKMGFLAPGEEEDLTFTFEGSGGHATVALDINKEALGKAASDWGFRLGMKPQELGLLLDVIDHFSKVELASWKDLVWAVKKALWAILWKLAGWQAKFWVNILPVAFDMASTVTALTDGRAHHHFPISVSAPRAGCTVTLRPGDSIQDAINKAPSGALICLSAGIWEEKEGIEITKSLTLQGAGRDSTVLEGNFGGVIGAVIGGDPQVTIEGLTIREFTWGVQVFGSAQATIQNSKVSRHFVGLVVYGSAQVTIQNSEVSRSGTLGLSVGEEAWVTVKDSKISSNAVGLSVHDSAWVTTRNSEISNNWWGLEVYDAARVTVQDSKISDSQAFGLQVYDSAQVTVQDSKILSTGGDGLSIYDAAQATIQNNEISNNGNGIRVEDSAQAHIIDNTIHENRGYGIEAKSLDNILECRRNKVYDNLEGDYNDTAAQKCQ